MIPFRDIELSDKQAIDSFICASGCHGADYSFANLYIWRLEYDPKIFIKDGRLLVYMPKYKIYAYPKGDGDVAAHIDAMLEDAHERGQKLIIRGLTDKTLDEFLPIYGERFEISEDRDAADYVYTAEKLRTLAGRKLAGKRNHIKHFTRDCEWELKRVCGDCLASCTEKLTDSDGKPIGCATLEEARKFLDCFYREKDDSDLRAETVAVNEMFRNFDELGFIGALLYQNGEPVAFTAGTKLGESAIDVHFEKALPGVDGAYPMINREYINMMCQLLPGLVMVNREEDMGLEGLRKAKLSYYPDILMMKYIAEEK